MICSIIVDLVRLLIYGWVIYGEKYRQVLSNNMIGILIAASLTAFVGSYIASKMIHQVKFRTIQLIVGIMLLVLGTAIASGVI